MNWRWQDVMGACLATTLLVAGLWAHVSSDSVQQLRGTWSLHAIR
jgi:hypothetical protein